MHICDMRANVLKLCVCNSQYCPKGSKIGVGAPLVTNGECIYTTITCSIYTFAR